MATNLYHWRYGRHSGIPDCCIQFWTTKYMDEFHRHSPYFELIGELSWGYVPCPECVAKGNKVHVIDCLKEHGRECRNDFINEPFDLLTNQRMRDIL